MTEIPASILKYKNGLQRKNEKTKKVTFRKPIVVSEAYYKRSVHHMATRSRVRFKGRVVHYPNLYVHMYT